MNTSGPYRKAWRDCSKNYSGKRSIRKINSCLHNMHPVRVLSWREKKLREVLPMTNIRNRQRPFRLLKYLYENTDETLPDRRRSR